jgi:hypothetical protein
MTRRDYELLAAVIAGEVKCWTGAAYSGMRLRAIESLTARLGNALAEDNPRFNITRFMDAAGFPQKETTDA